jgi:2-amino-4-hydroxy-6-hydroxymethyldihydropteridine diphosphokinase
MGHSPMKPPRIFLSLGSNLEPRFGHLQDAVRAIREIAQVTGCSGVYETAPVGLTDQPRFLNAALEVTTDRAPFELLTDLKAIEERLGRQARARWHEREIDIDIIFWDDLNLRSVELTIPHPEAHRRAFVLTPVADLDGNFVHPVFKRTVRELLQEVQLEVGSIKRTDLQLD